MPARAAHRRGVTLIELLIVVSIMSLLAACIALALLPILQHVRIKTATTNAANLRLVAVAWRARYDDDVCPTAARLIADKMVDRGSKTEDPWGATYAITCPEGDVSVLSPGPDRRVGTEDDIFAPPETRVAGGR